MILHDLRCEWCETVEERVAVEYGRYPRCPLDGGPRVAVPAAIAVDLYGTPQFNRGLGIEVSSNREAEREAARRGWAPAGDKVHGGPWEPTPRDREQKIRHRRTGPSRSGARFEDAAA